ncbi:hypothetical protein Tco_0927021 [Tanacetum coccineum]|uniref:Uncharacterized protein n=1 Tax=Tanacetum coccineum TaxID=301880 RepID=A0ABQ5DE38_9ASTR
MTGMALVVYRKGTGYSLKDKYKAKPDKTESRIRKGAKKRSRRRKKKSELKRASANARYWKIPVCYDDDDDEESSIPLKDIIISGLPPCVAITPDSPKTDSLIMEDEHLNTIPETESDELIKSSVEDLVQILKIHATEVNLIQNEVLESITSIPPGIDSFDAESNLIESLPNRNTSIDSSSKIDSLLDEFAGELTLLHSIPPGIDDVNLDPEGNIFVWRVFALR